MSRSLMRNPDYGSVGNLSEKIVYLKATQETTFTLLTSPFLSVKIPKHKGCIPQNL
jgi:hypothetical protein